MATVRKFSSKKVIWGILSEKKCQAKPSPPLRYCILKYNAV